MANSIVKTNIDKYAHALIDSKFGLHTYDNINEEIDEVKKEIEAFSSVDELCATILGGTWIEQDSVFSNTVGNDFFSAYGYDYFIYPDKESVDIFNKANIRGWEVKNGSITLICDKDLEEDVIIYFFRIENSKDGEEPAPASIVWYGGSNYDYSSIEAWWSEDIPSFEDFKASIQDDGLSYVILTMDEEGSSSTIPVCLISKIVFVDDVRDLVAYDKLIVYESEEPGSTDAQIEIDLADNYYHNIYTQLGSLSPEPS